MNNFQYKISPSQVGLIILIGKAKPVFKLSRVLGVSCNSKIMLRVFIKELEILGADAIDEVASKISHCAINEDLEKNIEQIFAANKVLPCSSESELEYLAQKINDYFLYKKEIEFEAKILELEKLTDFQRKILLTLKDVSLGKTVSYSELADKAGYSKAQRAVGSVMRKNPFPLLIPCHRVIRSDGKVGEFALGAEMKIKLLEHEIS